MDMAKAVLVLLVPIAILVAIYVYFFGGNNVIAIDPSETYNTAAASSNFTVVQPAGLPDGWKPVSAAYQDNLLRVGYVTPAGDGIQIVETSHPANRSISSEIGKTPSVAPVTTIGGVDWAQLTGEGDSIKALVSTVGTRTVIIKGDTDFATLARFASSLH